MRWMGITAALGLCAFGAQAQIGISDRSGEDTLACLQRPATPKYPDEALETRTSGFYRLELRFTDAKRAPEVKFLFSAGSEALRDAAEDYARKFRLPCLKAEHTLALLQEIRFRAVSDGDVSAAAPLNLPEAVDRRLDACLRTPPDSLRLNEPMQLQSFKRDLKNGNLVVALSFNAPDKPPEIRVLYDSLNRRHRDDVLSYVEEYRVPCMQAGQRYTMQQTFRVGFDNNRRFAFKDVGIVKFLGMVKNVDARPVHFELDTMGCPFRLSFVLGRPAVRNGVYENGTPNPNRLAFMAWLEELELALTKEQFENLLDAELLIDVPCGTIKLG
ncbi:MAG: hypothetical protein V3V71_10215 [Roseateles sp.]|jgi:hypothetical protein|nr:hypothetical protein [Methylibium sp.]MBY0368928.1 hypothetical protein [Burkholderiaceae bacterium]|mmetsp:Transcript_38680/g.90384  ORF Transcript_38680/g.90384 Transcript_38680/m.90384 type:complete len:329 (-) Transcript_38680:93-1079(-)